MKHITLKLFGTLLGLLGFASCSSTRQTSSTEGESTSQPQVESDTAIVARSKVMVMYGPRPATYQKNIEK